MIAYLIGGPQDAGAVIAYQIGGPQDMVKLIATDKLDNKVANHLDALLEAYGTRECLNAPGVVKNGVYVKVYETHGQPEPYAVYVYSPDGLVP